jgi:hypothetical protein
MSSRKKSDLKNLKISKKKRKIRVKKKAKIVKTCDQLKDDFKDIKSIDMSDGNQLELLKCISNDNRGQLQNNPKKYSYLYPYQDDPNFNVKIATKKEFYDNRYEEKTREEFDNIKEVAQKLCDNTEFELDPHQMFVRNYMSFQTPYNGLLLFHGLGTGKTCSSISVCEEMRTYLKQLGITKRIIIVASPAVQENFKIQLFDERKLKEVDGLWNIKACTGNKFIKEINPMNMKGLTRHRVVRQVKRIISQSYHFQGYIEFSNYISRVMQKTIGKKDGPDLIKRKQQRSLQREFSNRMLVIDEVHNLRITGEGTIKPSSENLLTLVTNASNLKLLLLSATPMFNDYQEIIWLLNLLNLNDKRYPVTIREIFDSNGAFVQNVEGVEIGKELLIQKMMGYISYVRGNNPFTFPYSVYPFEAGNPTSYLKMLQNKSWSYPNKQLNGKVIIDPIQVLDLSITTIGSYQKRGYDFVLDSLRKDPRNNLNNPNKGLLFTLLEPPLQALNMIYPHYELDNEDAGDDLYQYLYGKKGLDRTMFYDEKDKSNFRYKDITLEHFGRIFSPLEIGKYSAKIAAICESIRKSKGIIFVYSQYIDGGGVPFALALEEMGITRYGGRSLFKTAPTKPIDALTLKSEEVRFPAKYIMITGDKNLTPDVKTELKAITSVNNINGEMIKVVIVSRAGSEGLDFKNIRQTHILDPWYNLNRQEQIIGRSVRNFSHCALPFEERNVEIYLYGTKLDNGIESADMYIYRLAERKAKKIAEIVRLLKENAVDCLLNRKGQDFSEEIVDKSVSQSLSTGNEIDFRLGDKRGSFMCDFMDCNYRCNTTVQDIERVDMTTYNENFIIMNMDKILQRIRLLFKEYYIFDRQSLVALLTQIKNYPLDQIYTALNYLVTEKNEYLTDMLGRLGHLINIGNYYMFQPLELGSKPITRFDRVQPLDYKRDKIVFKLPDNIPSYINTSSDDKTIEESNEVMDKINLVYQEIQTPQFITSIDKENWVKSVAWAIGNLETYNGIERATLLKLAMHHFIDTLKFKEKLDLLNIIYIKKVKSPLEIMVMSYFKQFIIISGKYTGIVLADFSKPSTHESYTILAFIDGTWKSSKEAIIGGLAGQMFKQIQIKNISSINDIIGFMTIFKRQQVVFKTKDIRLSNKGRTNKGQRCDRGEGKGTIIERINSLLSNGVLPVKYIMNKSTVFSIYANENIAQKIQMERKIKEVKISSLQLCVESELIFRYYDEIKKDGKRWFFNTVDALINNIVMLGK